MEGIQCNLTTQDAACMVDRVHQTIEVTVMSSATCHARRWLWRLILGPALLSAMTAFVPVLTEPLAGRQFLARADEVWRESTKDPPRASSEADCRAQAAAH